MKLIGILVLSLSLSAPDLREAYKSQDEQQILSSLKELQAKSKLTSEEQCYKAVFLCLKAKFVVNPYTKFNSFSEGYTLLNQVIEDNSSNVEYRYHRYMIETNAPAWLIDNSHTEMDKHFIQTNLKSSNLLYDLIMKTIN